MPYADPAKRRAHNTTYKRRWRTQRKAVMADRADADRRREEREAELRAKSVVPMQLLQDMEFADHGHRTGEIVHVLPGLVHWWERKGLAALVEEVKPLPVATVLVRSDRC